MDDAHENRRLVLMSVDEYESIRLIDLEGITQEQCASQMGVARATVQAIYGSARCKLADCLVNDKELAIEGGSYVLCDARVKGCGCTCCRLEGDGTTNETKGNTDHE